MLLASQFQKVTELLRCSCSLNPLLSCSFAVTVAYLGNKKRVFASVCCIWEQLRHLGNKNRVFSACDRHKRDVTAWLRPKCDLIPQCFITFGIRSHCHIRHCDSSGIRSTVTVLLTLFSIRA